ncbi:MAG: CAP domain-containing protein [Anaerolineae bacterium]|jgi:uncharacterized protein YkwD
MKDLLRALLTLVLFLLLSTVPAISVPVSAQEEEAIDTFYELINEARLNAELPSYGRAPELMTSAQRHADDLATHQEASHIGTDGSTIEERVAEANYGAWSDGALVGENFWVGVGSVEDAFDWFMDNAEHRDNILSPHYREMGIGVATDEEGRSYYVLDFAARPNVLPIFINDGAQTTESADVAIRLSNETARPEGQGTLYVGRAIEIRINDTQDFAELPWQSWEELVAWTLADEPGDRAVYVQFRDGAGRTTTSVDTIYLLPGEGTPSPPPATPTAPSATAPPTKLPSGTAAPPEPTTSPLVTEPPSPGSSPTPAPVGEGSPPPFQTWTPLPSIAPDAPGAESMRLEPAIGVVCALQAVALLLGGYAALRRRPE